MVIADIKGSRPQISRENLIKIIIFVVIFGVFVAIVSALMTRYFSPSNNPYVEHFITNSNRSLWFYFLYTSIACVIVPIPTLPVDVVFLKLASPIPVIGLRLLADIAGSSVDFYLAGRYGRPLLRRWFSQKNYQFIENASEHLSWQQFFIVAMIPIFNTELLAYAGGISKLKYRAIVGSLIIAVAYRLVFVYLILKF